MDEKHQTTELEKHIGGVATHSGGGAGHAEASSGIGDAIATAAQGAYRRVEHLASDAGQGAPGIDEYLRHGRNAVGHGVREDPLVSLLIAGSIGYALGWLIHGQSSNRGQRGSIYTRR